MTAEQSDALKLLKMIAGPCNGTSEHSWRKCQRCLALHDIEQRLDLSMRLLAAAIDGLEEWLP